MDTEALGSPAQPKTKESFCATNKCSCLVFILVAAAIGVLIAVTLASPAVRAKVRDSSPGLQWWQTAIVYQIYPRSFQDSDGDGVGDLKGIISRLDYFPTIHVSAIWLSPFYKSPMRDFGYDVTNYTEVDPLFGTMEDFESLVKDAHSKGLKVIVDFVPNHTSNDSTWFDLSRRRQGRYTDYYVWSDGVRNSSGRYPPNNWQSVFEGSAWKWDEVRNQYFYHAFLESQPDLNFRNMHVREEMKSVLRFWCDKGVDGFRVDAIPHMFEVANQSMDEPAGPSNGFNPNLHKYTKNQPEIFDVVREWRALLDEYKERDGNTRFLVAETVGIPHEVRMQYYKAGSVPFFFDLIAAKDICKATAGCFLQIIKDGLNLTEGQWPNFVIGNHDNWRIASSMGADLADAMNVMLLTLPGTPTTYYGEELGMHNGDYYGLTPQDPYAITSNDWTKSRDPERNPMQWNTSANAGFSSGTPWLAVNRDYWRQNVQSETDDTTSSLRIYRGLAELRQQSAFQSTHTELPESAKDVLVYVRGEPGYQQYAVAINFGVTDTFVNLDIGYGRGAFVIATKPRNMAKDADLKHVFLRKGEGVVLQLLE